MKKEYFSPELEMIILNIQNQMLLTGSVELGGDNSSPNDDNGDEVEFG